MRLRYTGPQPITFVAIGLEVAPGDEFDVPDDTAAAYTGRPDIEPVTEPKPRRRPKADAPTTDPDGDTPELTKKEAAGRGVPDDH